MSRLGTRLRRAWALRRTLRMRLTLWYVALLAVILIAFSGFLYLNLSTNLHAEADRSLVTEAQRLTAMLDISDGTPQLGDGTDNPQSGTVAALYDKTGTRLLANDRRNPLPSMTGELARAVRGQNSLSTVKMNDGTEWRVLTTPVLENGQPVGILQVARPESGIRVALSQLLTVMAFAIPLTLLLAVAGGVFLAGRALDPIDRITRTVDQIGAADLSRRLDLSQSDDEVGRLASTFDRMLARLEDAFRRQRQFTADASHELRTPLAMLIGQVDVTLTRRRTGAEYERALTSIRDDAGRMSQLLGELLALARTDDGQTTLTSEPVDLAELSAQVVTAMQPLAKPKGIQLQRRDGPVVPILGDQTRLTQLLVNLVDNAVKYTPKGGTVTVSAEMATDGAVLQVIDTGIGIPPEHLPHLFERFYRVDRSRARPGGGAGLGLAICRWIATAHGGTIGVDSQIGRGTTFTVRLPVGAPLKPALLSTGSGKLPPVSHI